MSDPLVEQIAEAIHDATWNVRPSDVALIAEAVLPFIEEARNEGSETGEAFETGRREGYAAGVADERARLRGLIEQRLGAEWHPGGQDRGYDKGYDVALSELLALLDGEQGA